MPEQPERPLRLKDRVALVFGAGSSGPGWGNGKAAAVNYAREGALVVAVDQFTRAAEETAEIIALEGHVGLALQADVTKADSIGRAVEAVLARFGRIDVLHNNVGITDMGALEDITEARWQKTLDVLQQQGLLKAPVATKDVFTDDFLK